MTAQIKLKHSGGNGVIIEAPASNPASDKTITLPSDEAGVFATKDSANSLQNVTGINGGQLGNRNLVINGAMQVAQRGASATTNGYGSVDRFSVTYDSGLTEAPTQEQLNLSSSDTPYASGFRNAFRITNGNQTSQDANDYIQLVQKIEAQDIAQSGWNYTSSSSNITLSFWVRASIAQTFYVKIQANDNARSFTFPINVTTSWQKLTKTISGDSNLVFNNDTGTGMEIRFIPYYGTSYTDSGHSINTWIVSTGTNQTPDYANTWFSGNDATFDVTGVQLEVGSVATDFEHRSFAQELMLCERYYQLIAPSVAEALISDTVDYDNTTYFTCDLHTPMRIAPSLVVGNHTDAFRLYGTNPRNVNTLLANTGVTTSSKILLYATGGSSGAVGFARVFKNTSGNQSGGTYAIIAASAEL